jgi:hypothetical protein
MTTSCNAFHPVLVLIIRLNYSLKFAELVTIMKSLVTLTELSQPLKVESEPYALSVLSTTDFSASTESGHADPEFDGSTS